MKQFRREAGNPVERTVRTRFPDCRPLFDLSLREYQFPEGHANFNNSSWSCWIYFLLGTASIAQRKPTS